jgi:hypothetical protein
MRPANLRLQIYQRRLRGPKMALHARDRIRRHE